MIVHTKCHGCVFAVTQTEPNQDTATQTGCTLDRHTKLGVLDTDDNGSFNLTRFCTTYRPRDWLSSLTLEEAGDMQNVVLSEVAPRVGFLVLFDQADSIGIDQLKHTIDQIRNQINHAASYVIVVNSKVEYNDEIQNYLVEVFDQDVTMHHIVQLNTDFPNRHHLIDESLTHMKNGWVCVTSAGEDIKTDLIEKLHQSINIDKRQITVVKPYDEINGMLFQTALFKYLNGNGVKHWAKDDFDDRPFLEKVAEMAEEYNDKSLLEWEDFYGR